MVPIVAAPAASATAKIIEITYPNIELLAVCLSVDRELDNYYSPVITAASALPQQAISAV